MNPQAPSPVSVLDSFQNAALSNQATGKKKTASPFSLRLTPEEREYLNQQTGARPLGAYIRERLLGDRTEKRRTFRKPHVDEKQLALVLAELGRSRLSSNLNQLAKAANTGTLPLPHEVERDLREACKAILAMRDALIAALGLKTEAGQ